ncbi:MAG: hypothetical protein E7047_03495 [Lentisphaerae bacterium]|nr:hypothetical protein [Lentisphaerota bacterium]
MQSGNRRNFIVDFFRHDFWRKLVAFFLTMLLYLSIAPRTGEKYEKTFHNIPVNIEMPSNIALSGHEVPKVNITLSGNNKKLDKLDPSTLNIRAVVHQERIIPGEPYTLHLQSENVKNLPFGVRVSSFSPRELTLELDQITRKDVNIHPNYDYTGSFSRNYYVSDLSLSPQVITLTGPEKMLKDIKVVTTKPIPLGDKLRDGTYRYDCYLDLPRGIRVSDSDSDPMVAAYITIVSHTFVETKNVKVNVVLPPSSQNITAGITGEKKEVEITLQGPRRDMEILDEEDKNISASVIIPPDLPAGEYDLPVEINVPQDLNNKPISIHGPRPDSVRVKVSITPNQEKTDESKHSQSTRR